MRSACHSVLLLIAAGSTSGCYLFHGASASAPSPADAGARAIDAAPVRPIDAAVPGAPDASLECPLVRPDLTCLESFLVAPGRAFTLPYAFDGCGCCVRTECRVSIDAAARTLRLDTTLCPDPCDCAECALPSGGCEVPALAEGDWTVIANGEPAFSLPVHPDPGLVPPPPACASYAEIDRCGPSAPVPGRAIAAGEIACAETAVHPSGLDVVRLRHACWSCGDLRGACVASLEERFTDDLPPGGDLHLAPSRYPTACDVDCPGVCIDAERDCFVPALRPGDTYRVFVGGSLLTTFVAGGPSTGCSELHR